MKKLKINSLAKLHEFVSDSTVSVENRYKIFSEALKGFDFFTMVISNNSSGAFENPEKVVFEMKKVITELQTNPEITPAGFVVMRKTK